MIVPKMPISSDIVITVQIQTKNLTSIIQEAAIAEESAKMKNCSQIRNTVAPQEPYPKMVFSVNNAILNAKTVLRTSARVLHAEETGTSLRTVRATLENLTIIYRRIARNARKNV